MNSITFLGTGTSHGIPVPGCSCRVCLSDNAKNKRTRSSLYVKAGGICILIDTATEFRIQAVSNNIKKIDAVFLTHDHADHIFGFDDLRGFNMLQNQAIPCYSSEQTIKSLRRIYDYVFTETQRGGGKPQVLPSILAADEIVSFPGLKVEPLLVQHGKINVYGYLFTTAKNISAAYITDCNMIPDSVFEKITDVDFLVLGALRYRKHPTHFTIDEALDVALKTNAKQIYFTHICHEIEHEKVNNELPGNVFLAYDSLEISF